MCDIRGKEISMIFQEPMIALNPLFNVEYQIGEVIKEHTNLKKRKEEIIIDLLEKVRIKTIMMF
ncbi:hypothetical protein Q5M85_14305 [Paraclostridium bifermentans]|nr:hypothetical protein [Paraclostridium bifermentans]